MYNDKTYAIAPIAELNNIDYSQVGETSANTVRKNVADTEFVLKWDGDMPSSVSAITPTVTAYTHEEILAVMATEEWTPPIEE
ncbi:hypothetical protein N8508_00130 [bacterium]|nr:hypothetical protein [bacterium]